MIWLFYILEILLASAIVGVVFMQKGSDGIFSRDTKMFGVRGRTNMLIKVTYILGSLFMLNSLVLGISYQKQFKAESIQAEEKKDVVKEDKKVEVEKKANVNAEAKIEGKDLKKSHKKELQMPVPKKEQPRKNNLVKKAK